MPSLFKWKNTKRKINRNGNAFKFGMDRTRNHNFIRNEFPFIGYKTKMRIIIFTGSHVYPFGESDIAFFLLDHICMNKHTINACLGISILGKSSLSFKIELNGITLKRFGSLSEQCSG